MPLSQTLENEQKLFQTIVGTENAIKKDARCAERIQ